MCCTAKPKWLLTSDQMHQLKSSWKLSTRLPPQLSYRAQNSQAFSVDSTFPCYCFSKTHVAVSQQLRKVEICNRAFLSTFSWSSKLESWGNKYAQTGSAVFVGNLLARQAGCRQRRWSALVGAGLTRPSPAQHPPPRLQQSGQPPQPSRCAVSQLLSSSACLSGGGAVVHMCFQPSKWWVFGTNKPYVYFWCG